MTESVAKQIRRAILEQSKRAHVGHIESIINPPKEAFQAPACRKTLTLSVDE